MEMDKDRAFSKKYERISAENVMIFSERSTIADGKSCEMNF
jgi:hypothetical protein